MPHEHRPVPVALDPCCVHGFLLRVGVTTIHLSHAEVMALREAVEAHTRSTRRTPWVLPLPGAEGPT